MTEESVVLGVVMARAGSVGLKDKHLRLLLGRPVIDYTLDHADAAELLTHTVVTSDSSAVLEIAAERGLVVLDRPAELCTPHATVQAVMLHAMQHVERELRVAFDAFVILYGNVPVRPSGVIDRAIEHWRQTGCDSVRTFCPVGKWHPAWMSRLNDDRVEACQPGSIDRRQDLEPLFLHDGAVVVLSRSSLLLGQANPLDPHAMFGSDRRGILTDAGATVEIDAQRDLYWAEAALREEASA